VVCKPSGRRARPALAEFTQQVSAGILYQERVTPDQTRLELAWRPVGEARWTGKSLVPTDVEQCQPLLLEGDGVVAACRLQDEGRSVTGRRLVRPGPRSRADPDRECALRFPVGRTCIRWARAVCWSGRKRRSAARARSAATS
jgi:hypothetical protein